MKKITVYIDDKYGDILTLTAVGVHTMVTNVTSFVVDLNKVNFVEFKDSGNTESRWEEGEMNA